MNVHLELQPWGRRVQAEGNSTVLDAVRLAVSSDEGILSAPCGGQGRCGRCRVRIIQGQVSPFSATEREILSTEELEGCIRLACQVKLLGDCKFEILPESISGQQDLQIEGVTGVFDLDPVVRRYVISTKPPSISRPLSTWQQILMELETRIGITKPTIDEDLLRADFGENFKEGDRIVTLKDSEIINRFDESPAPRSLGLAVDCGSTKVAAFLVDFESGDRVASEAAMNPQIVYGEDIMSRLAYADTSLAHRLQMQSALSNCINRLLTGLLSKTGLQSNQVEHGVIVGNTAIHHMFLGLPVHDLVNAPYLPVTTIPLEIKASSFGLAMAPGATVYFAPPIAGFVGGDHVAMITASRIFETKEITLGLDIGTNTEIVLSYNGQLSCCSCASGPAFEGGNIRHGMRAVGGAIYSVAWSATEQKLLYHTIGDVPARGLCGSGVIDAVSGLVNSGIVNRLGLFDSNNKDVRINPETGEAEYVIASRSESGVEQDVTLTQKDIVAVQLAKAAIRAGSELLLSSAGVEYADLEKVVIAGAFGSSLNLKSAISLGLLPAANPKIFHNIGNAAGAGARLMLLSGKERRLAEEISTKVRYIELAANSKFASEFARALEFGRA